MFYNYWCVLLCGIQFGYSLWFYYGVVLCDVGLFLEMRVYY